MDQDKKKQEVKGRFWEILRCLLYTTVVVFVMSCIAFLYLEQRQLKQSLAAINDKTDKMITEEMLKKFFSANRLHNDTDERLDEKALLLRRKRAMALSLESLEKRLKVLETR